MDDSAVPSRLGERILYRSTGVSPLRILTIVALAFALGSGLLAVLMLDRSAHMGNAITFTERAVWAGGLLLTFCGFFVAVWMYERRVAARIVLSEDGRNLRVTTATLFGLTDRDIPVDDLMTSQYHDGDSAGEEATSPPWLWVKVRGRPSFVVALDGQIPDRQELLQILSATR